jgi:transglutaminase-like putative cysteine protease
LAAVISLGRLFSTSNWIAPVVTMALGMHAVSWLARRQRWSPATSALAIAAAFVLLASWLVLASSTRFGLPLSGTWHAVGQAVRDARSDYNGAVAPTPATHGLIFVTTVAVGGLAVLADWAAFRMRATIEATVPSLTLFVFTSYLRGRQDRSQIIALELAALVAFIVVHQSTVGRDRSAWFANRPTGALSSAYKTGGVIGIVAIVICLNLAFRLPGAGARAVLKLRPGDHGARIAPDPLVDVRSRLLDHSGVPLFTVQSSTASYWRLTSLDTYSGTEWTANDSYAPVHTTLPKDGATTKGVKVEQDFTIDQLDSPWLPAAYQPESISGADVKSGISYDPQSGSLITSQNTSSGLKYHVTSTLNVGQLSPTLLEGAPAVSPNDRSLARYVKLPHIDDRVTALAQAITTGKKTEYDKALALQNYLRDPANFTYDDTFDPRATGSNALSYFLFTSKRGYCQQFAGSFAVMARELGLPTRLALGWTYGKQTDGTWTVTADEYHTWPEVYFPEVGWVPFEPTPGRGIPGAEGYTDVAAAQQGSSPGLPSSATPATAADGSAADAAAAAAAAAKKLPGADAATSGNTSTAGHRSDHSLRTVALTALVVIGSLVLIGGLWVVGLAVVRNRRSRRRRQDALGSSASNRAPPDAAAGTVADPAGGLGPADNATRGGRRHRQAPLSVDPGEEIVARAEVLVAWAETVELLAWWRTRRRPAETYQEFARRAAVDLRVALGFDRGAAQSLVELGSAATKAEFGGRLSIAEAESAVKAAASVSHSLRSSATRWQRCRLAIDPRLAVGRL